MTRLWDSAVVWRRSIASVAICTAVWKPKVKSVPARSLSIVLGTPTTATPSSASRRPTPSVAPPRGAPERVLAADRDQPVEAVPLQRGADALEPVVLLVGVRPRRAEDGAAAV